MREKITVTELKNEIDMLEVALNGHLQKHVDLFYQRTGYTPSSIDIGMTEMSEIGQPPKNIITGVK